MAFSSVAISDLLADPFFTGDFSRFFSTTSQARNGRTDSREHHPALPLNVAQTGTTLEVACEVPGVKQEDLSVIVTANQLEISGNRGEPISGTLVHNERWSGRFQRTLKLPFAVDTENVEATYSCGVLTVKLTKAALPQEKRIQIKQG